MELAFLPQVAHFLGSDPAPLCQRLFTNEQGQWSTSSTHGPQAADILSDVPSDAVPAILASCTPAIDLDTKWG